MYLIKIDDNYLQFHKCPTASLYQLHIKEAEKEGYILTVMSVGSKSKLITVEDNIKDYSLLDCTCAKKLQDLKQIIVCPSDEDLANIIENNIIENNPF